MCTNRKAPQDGQGETALRRGWAGLIQRFTYVFRANHSKMAAPIADPNQLAGHAGNILKLDGGKIMKLVKDPEANFYKGLAARNLPAEALEFIPKFFGVQETDGKRP